MSSSEAGERGATGGGCGPTTLEPARGPLPLSPEIADKLIEKAENLAKGFGKEKGSMTTALRNLFEAAVEAPTFRVLLAFLKYQIGRAIIPVNGGHEVLDRLLEVEGLARRGVVPLDELRLAQYLLAFLYRAYVYEAAEQRSQDSTPRAGRGGEGQ